MALMKHTRKKAQTAFTLVELLVVIGLMAVLATISVAGYSAASRGMADRGVVQTTESILRVAQQACNIDHVRTKVLFFNQRLDNGSEDATILYQGTAIAIKQAGRITLKPDKGDKLLIDEFADWNQSYPTDDGDSSGPGIRMFWMNEDGGNIDTCSTLVQPSVTSFENDDYMIQAGAKINDWCSRNGNNANNSVWGFKPIKGKSDWNVGDPYGIEIARIDLPKGYIFGEAVPSGFTLELAKISVDFKAGGSNSSASVPIYALRPGKRGTYDKKPVGPAVLSTENDN